MIRRATPTDFTRIYELGSLLHEDFEHLYNLEDLLNKEYYHLLVYEENNIVLGFLMFTSIFETIDIIDIVVDPAYRKKKIGILLLDEMITNSKKESKIYLEVNVNNKSAINLYQKFGFQTIHIRKKYYGAEDALIMERVNENE